MLKAVTLDGVRTCVSLLDPAIDHESMTDDDHAEYEMAWRTGGDWRAKLKVKSGEELTIFTIGTLTSEQLNTILDDTKRADGATRGEERYWRLFLAGVRDIRPWFSDVQRDDRGRIKTSWLTETFVGPLRRAAQSIGVYVLAYNNVTEEEIKNSFGRSRHKSDTAALSAPSATIASDSAVAAKSPA